MKFLTQTRVHNPPVSYGDCFRTCVACILDLDPCGLPLFEEMPGDTWWQAVLDFASELKLKAQCFSLRNSAGEQVRAHYDDLTNIQSLLPRGLSILTGKSPRGDCDHCIVAKDGIPFWDVAPNAKQPGELINFLDWIFFEPMEG